MADLTPAARVEAWNREHPVGTWVYIYGGLMAYKTTQPAFVNACGDAIIFLDGGLELYFLKDVKPIDDLEVIKVLEED